MGLKINLNGNLVAEEEARVSVFDHGLLYGDGVFEGIRVYSGNVFRLDQHVDRLYRSAHTLMIDLPLKREEMAARIVETVRANNLTDAYIRVVVTRGPGDLGLDPRKCARPTYFIIADRIQLYPEESYREGIAIVTVPTRRNGLEMLSPGVKSLNYLNNILAKIEGNNSGVVESLMLNSEGLVLECTGDNIFLVRGAELLTPPLYLGILDGITRQAVIDSAPKAGLVPREVPFTRHDVFNADEVFLTGTAAELVPVTRVDGRLVSSGKPGSLTLQLRDIFQQLTTTEGVRV